MNLEEQKRYIKEVAIVIMKKILLMMNVNKTIVDINNVRMLAKQAAIDLLNIGIICNGEYGLFDEFTSQQLDSNCRVGELQIYFSDFAGTKINVSRFGAEDLSDLSIRLINNSNDYSIVIVVSKSDRTIQIKNSTKELRFQGGSLKISDKSGMYEFVDVRNMNLKTAINLFNTDINTLSSTNLLEGTHEDDNHSMR